MERVLILAGGLPVIMIMGFLAWALLKGKGRDPEEDEYEAEGYRELYQPPTGLLTPVDFPERNVLLGEHQPEYKTLPSLRVGEYGEVITCWRVTRRQRWILLFTGRLWLSQLTFNKRLQPVKLTIDKQDLFLPAPNDPAQE
ncbi:hypothetical protein A6C57_00045 [Fibrella sp. ES10-3-2-2]|nr:hypothetical protein A6C57_00045 [Fibrella sp. ES10-3-2-2]